MLNLPVQLKNNVQVMSSVDLAKLCVGESKDAHSNFMKKAEKVLGDGVVSFYDTYISKQGKSLQCLMLPEREACLMAMSYSYELQAYVFDQWQDAKNNKQMTQLEIMAQSALALVEHEKKLTALEAKAEEQQKAIEDLRDSYSILPQKPANAESVSYIRMRVNRDYGLPPRIINEVLYSFPYSPNPAGQVRNTHENANNGTYTVWNTSEVTKLFKRFVSECEMVTKTQAVHPSVDGRFKLVVKP